MAGEVRSIRRLVTGHDAAGRSVFISDAHAAVSMTLAGTDNFAVTDLWKTAVPAAIDGAEETCAAPITLAPPAGGVVVRVVQFPPDDQYIGKWDAAEGFASLGASGAEAFDLSERHEAMHKTRSVDFAIVLEGEIWAMLDTDERAMKAGDVLIQRGTNHAWSNRGTVPSMIAFVLVDGAPPTTSGI